MRRLATFAALALVLLAAGCGSSNPHSSRPAVAAYINRVNAIERQLAAPLKAVTVAGSKLSESTAAVNQVQVASLGGATSRIVALRDRLAAIPVPTVARQLRILVLLLAGGEIDMTNELSGMFTFLPRYANALRQLTPVTAELRTALSGRVATSGSAAQAGLDRKAQALARYRTQVTALRRVIARITPPPVAVPQWDTELRAMSAMETSAGALAHGLRSDSPDVASQLAAFNRAAVATESLAAQRAQRAAIRSYDGRVAKLNTLAGQVAAARLKLQETLR
jgi:hypothetical protein